MSKYNLIGNKYGRLTVLKLAPKRENSTKRYWICECECGNIIEVRTANLISGHTKSCGCLHKEILKQDRYGNNIDNINKHKIIYSVWNSMRSRCYNPKNKAYKYYGERGIKICDEWQYFPNFKKWACENGYNIGLTIDRIDSNGNYEPNNCRWTTMKKQQNNKRNTKYLTYKGITKPVAEWRDIYGLTKDQINYRIRAGWDIEEILGIKPRKRTRKTSTSISMFLT